ncbi:MAG: ArsC/Spx/MgsR family protein [Alphaproteobacteria bacterium]
MRKYDPLFHSLQLDDRFLSENEFWDGVVEHPSLLDGPVLTNGGKARICRSGADVKAFFSDAPVAAASAKPKTLSPRLLMLMSGQSVPPLPPKPKVAEIVEPPKKTPVEAPAKIKLAPRASAAKKPEAKAEAKKAEAKKAEAKPKAAAKPAAKKAVKAAKPAAAKKKAKR